MSGLFNICTLTVQAYEEVKVYTGKSLIEVLKTLNTQGFKLIYSSMQVHSGMLIKHEPSDKSGLALIESLLSEFSLTLKSGPNNSQIIIKKMENVGVVNLAVNKPIIEPIVQPIEKIMISASQFDLVYSSVAEQEYMDQKDIERLSILGKDVNRAIALLPGVAGGDISSRLHIRGGTSKENLFLLDGMPLIDPFHLKDVGGILGIVDAFSIGNAQVITGGAPVEFGNHLSGIVQLTSNNYSETNPWSIGASLLDFKVKGSGSFNNENDDWFFVLRKGAFSQVSALSKVDFGDYNPKYLDLFAKINKELTFDTLLTWHSLIGKDNTICLDDCFTDEERGSYSGYHWLTFDTDWTEKLSSSSLIGSGNLQSIYQTGFTGDKYFIALDDTLKWGFLIFKQDWQYRASSSYMLKMGFEVKRLDAKYRYKQAYHVYNPFRPMSEQLEKTFRQSLLDQNGSAYSAYLASRFKVNKRVTVETGLRWDKQSYTNEEQFSPRFNFTYDTSDNSNLKLSWGVYQQAQGVHQLLVEDGVESFNTAQKVKKINLAYQRRLFENYSYKVSLYNKDYDKLLPRFENVLFPGSNEHGEINLDRKAFNAQSAYAKGMELIIEKKDNDKLNWRFAYSLSKTEDVINDIQIPRHWDQRHAFKFSSNYQFSSACDISLAANYHTGWRATKVKFNPLYLDDEINQANLILGPTYEAKYPDYFRVDLGIGCEVKLSNSKIRYTFGALNIFDRENASGTSSISDLFSSEGIIYGVETNEDDTYIPLIPSVSIVWHF
ncbi:TonB-dependent receptor plug domain-containing protein [Pseudoalteromonas denitrificans]|uniref:TonB-dependent receptor plug domain-containing protein n=1 Tax=Pseudoalteromonas denitrificans TaxID=43656 RepID=UPI0015A54C09|nr:TonB-dependent receptor [Pseudoalteromonas denitrificans]